MRLADWLWLLRKPVDVLGNGGVYAARWVYWLVIAVYIGALPLTIFVAWVLTR